MTVNRSLIDAHVPAVYEQVTAMLEAELLVVGTDGRIVAETVKSEEVASGGRGRCVGPLDDCRADPPARTRATHRELVDVRGVGRTLAPVHRVVPEQRDRGDHLSVELGDVHLAAVDR